MPKARASGLRRNLDRLAKDVPCPVCGLLDSRSVRRGEPYCIYPGGDSCVKRGYQRLGDLVVAKDRELSQLRARLLELEGRINTPHTAEWFEAVRLEAAHQLERWGSEHDAGKAPTDWLWLIGYLVGKACSSAIKGDVEKAKHHTVSTGAVLLNWFRALAGDGSAMRPGIEPPDA